MAGPARLSVTIPLAVGHGILPRQTFFPGLGGGRNTVASLQPIIQIDQLTPFAAEGAERIAFPRYAFPADGAGHNRLSVRGCRHGGLDLDQRASRRQGRAQSWSLRKKSRF